MAKAEKVVELLELAGEVADGVLMLVGLHPDAIAAAREHLRVGAARTNRDTQELREVFIVPIALGERSEVRRWPQRWFREGQPWLEYPSRSNLRWLREAGIEVAEGTDPSTISDDLAERICDAFGLFGDPVMKFRIFMCLSRIRGGDVNIVGFAPYIGLTGHKDANNTIVAEQYREWFRARRRREKDVQGLGSRTGFSQAVAALLGVQQAETDLKAYLDETYDQFAKQQEDLKLRDLDNIIVQEEIFRSYREWELREHPNFYKDIQGTNALEYMVCLALSWLHFENRQQAGVPAGDIRVPGFPPGPTGGWLPRPTVPAEVAKEQTVPALVRGGHTGAQPVDVFKGPAFPEGPGIGIEAIPPPNLGTVIREDVYTITVPESRAWVDTKIDLFRNDSVSFEATGEIWAGVWLTGTNGPEGWVNWITHNREYPLHEGEQAHPFALLYTVVDPQDIKEGILGGVRIPILSPMPSRYYYIGKGDAADSTPRTGKGAGHVEGRNGPRRLILRTNDNNPGNGSGSFTCTVRVKRVQR